MVKIPPPPGSSVHQISEAEYSKIGSGGIGVAIFGFGNFLCMSTSDGEALFVKNEYNDAARHLLNALRALPG